MRQRMRGCVCGFVVSAYLALWPVGRMGMGVGGHQCGSDNTCQPRIPLEILIQTPASPTEQARVKTKV